MFSSMYVKGLLFKVVAISVNSLIEKGVVNDLPIINKYGSGNDKNAGIFASYRLLHVQILLKSG